MKKTLLPLLLNLFVQCTVHAQWNLNPAVNTPISTGTGKSSRNPWICKDGTGGYYITWMQSNGATFGSDIYLQHLDEQGLHLWSLNGIRVSNVVNSEFWPRIVHDAAGGVYVVWQDQRNGVENNDIYAQHYAPDGTALWSPNGIPIASNTLVDEFGSQVIADNAGGMIICWWSATLGGLVTDVLAQRLDRSGTKLWTAGGVPVSTAPNRQDDPRMISDGSGGAIIAWSDFRNSPSNNISDIYAQRITNSGAIAWTVNGVAVSTAPRDQIDVQLTTDGQGGAIITWTDLRNWIGIDQNADIYAQRISANGTALWSPNGNAVSVAGGTQAWPMIVDDDAGGAIICFFDTRNGGLGNAIYVQHMSSDGIQLWPQDGVPASNYTNSVSGGFIVKDGNHGAIVAWEQIQNNTDIFAQHIYQSGIMELHVSGYAVSTAPNAQRLQQAGTSIITGWMIDSEANTAVVTWQDSRDINADIYATKIYFKPPVPIILNVKDQCTNAPDAIGKLLNPPAGVTISITQDGTPLTYNPADSSFTYFVNGVTPGGNHTIEIEYTNIAGGALEDSVYAVRPNADPAISIATFSTTMCERHTVIFTATATRGGTAPVYQWQLNGANVGTNSSTWSSTTLEDGDIVTCIFSVDPNVLACATRPSVTSNALTMTITAAVPPTLTITGSDNGICPGTAITFAATGTNLGAVPSYHWKLNGSEVGSDQPTYITDSLKDSDELICIVFPGVGACINTIVVSNDIIMVVHPVPVVSLSPLDTSILVNSQVTLNATITGDYQSYAWSPATGLGNPSSLTPVSMPVKDDANYTLIVETDEGCIIEKHSSIKVLFGGYIPTGFTPNGDGLNDVFRIPPRVLQSLKRFSIFNRWGNMVFTTKDLNEGWDGKVKGSLSDAGVYVYVIEGFDSTKNVFLKGTFTLVR
jgi:gliding motility-associated-like protein